MTTQLKTAIVYPDGDGKPMAESDATRDYLIYGVEALGFYFQNRKDVYVSGNLFIYYKKGVPSAVVAPDVFVIFGVENRKRMSYKAWEENNKLPDFILEITSATTQENDDIEKPIKYAQMGVTEYFQYDPSGDYLTPRLKGSRLIEGVYQPIPETILSDGTVSIHSDVLGLDLRLIEGELRFFDPKTGEKFLSNEEREQARQQAELARQQAELARQQAELARQQAELERQQAELARQQAELERQQAEQTILDAIPRLRGLGLTDEQIAVTLSLSVEQVKAVD